MHIRDLTISPTSGVDEAYRGTYRGAHQTGTKNAQGDATAFDYIKELGVNVVQLQPVTDRYKAYDEEGNVLYNWGYDVQNYSAPETWYSTKPHDPKTTMRELKEIGRASCREECRSRWLWMSFIIISIRQKMVPFKKLFLIITTG